MNAQVNDNAAPARQPPPIARPEPAPPEPNLRAALALLWRRKALVFATVLLTTLGTLLVVFQLTPRYTADVQILIAPRDTNVVDIEDVLESLRPDPMTVRTEVELLRSRALAETVVDQLGLVEVAEFNRRLRPPSLRNPIDWFRRAVLKSGATVTPEEAERLAHSDTVTALMDAVNVEVIMVSRMVSVAATSEDRELAAAIANTLAETYLDEQLQAKFRATEQASVWLNERVATLREQVEGSNQAVEDHRQAHGLTQASSAVLVEEQISEVNTRLIAAQADVAAAEARLRHARQLMASEGGIYGASEVLSSTLIQNLRLQEAELAGQAAQMTAEYGPRHPKMINITAELEDIRAKITAEVQRIVRSLANAVNVARTRESTLERSLDGLKTEASRLASTQARLRVLEREAEANQGLFDVFLARQKETGESEELQNPDGRIISPATAPASPSWPNAPVIILVAFVASIVLALLLVYLVEQVFERGFAHADQMEQALGLGTLSAIPLVTEEQQTLAQHVLEKPTSALAESLRMLHAGLLLADFDGAPCVSVLVTSSVAGEGKTVIATSLARLLASTGHKVLLIDADLRHGRVANWLGLPSKNGLANVLTRRLPSVEGAIQRDEISGLDVLPAGKTELSATNIVRSRQMADLIESMRSQYEMIIIDSPPLLLVSDARTLARLADRTVFVVRWTDTARGIATAGLKALASGEARIAGSVLSMVEARKNAGYYPYGYGDGPGAYGQSKKYGAYYAET